MADFLKTVTSLYANELLFIVTRCPKIGHITSSLFASKPAPILLTELTTGPDFFTMLSKWGKTHLAYGVYLLYHHV